MTVIDKEKLDREWYYLLLVYGKLNWNGKRVARKKMNKIRHKLRQLTKQ